VHKRLVPARSHSLLHVLSAVHFLDTQVLYVIGAQTYFRTGSTLATDSPSQVDDTAVRILIAMLLSGGFACLLALTPSAAILMSLPQ
jgi:hypothetical protein